MTSWYLDVIACASSFLQGCADPWSGVPPAVKGKLTREVKKEQQHSKVKSSALLPEFRLTAGRGKAVAVPKRLAVKKRGGPPGGGGLDVASAQVDPDVPVAQDEGEIWIPQWSMVTVAPLNGDGGSNVTHACKKRKLVSD